LIGDPGIIMRSWISASAEMIAHGNDNSTGERNVILDLIGDPGIIMRSWISASAEMTAHGNDSKRRREKCHPRENGNPEILKWIPAYAGMTVRSEYDTSSYLHKSSSLSFIKGRSSFDKREKA